MIFIDSNVPMYLVGSPHPNKDIAQRLLELATARQERLVTDAEVLQEILHRYHAIQRLEAIQPAFDALLPLVDEVLPVELRTVERAKEIVGASTAYPHAMPCTLPPWSMPTYVRSCLSMQVSIAGQASSA